MGEIWTSHLEEYLLFVQGTKNFSHHTLVNYRRDIQKFMEFLRRINGDGFLRCGVDTYTARRYLATLVAGEYARRTIARQIAVLRSYGRYLCRNNCLSPILSSESGRPSWSSDCRSFWMFRKLPA